MMECIALQTSAGTFTAHYLKGRHTRLLVFVPGLMEPKSGLNYIWSTLATLLWGRGYSCLLFDLAGQGDSLLPMQPALWREQRASILRHFAAIETTFITRGVGCLLLTDAHDNIAIEPSLADPLAMLLPLVRWQAVSQRDDLLTPAAPLALTSAERECFQRLGAEDGCLGGMMVPRAFVEELPASLPVGVGPRTRVLQSSGEDRLFAKQRAREELFANIYRLLQEMPCTEPSCD